jgi:hypothetical protein
VDEGFNPSGFDGVWRMDLSQSQVRDPSTGEWQPEWLRGQINEIRHEGATQHFRLQVQVAVDLVVFKAFTATLGAPGWAPYDVVHIDGDPHHERLGPGGLLKGGMRSGEPAAWVKLLYVDPRTQYRVNRNPDGSAQYLLLRRLSEDGQRLTGTVLTPDGEAIIAKAFVRDPQASIDLPSATAGAR